MLINKKRILNSLIAFFIIASVFLASCVSVPYMDREDYMSLFGIEGLFSYNDIKSAKFNEILSETTDSMMWITLVFDGYAIAFNENKIIANIRVNSPDYKLGKHEIGIGSTIQEISHAYRFQEKVKDTDYNEVGFIDGYSGNPSDDSHKPWIFFLLDENSLVYEIIICPVGIF